jgi:O-antigen/teichoic acid export membrane protein
MKFKLTTVSALQSYQLMRYGSLILIGIFMAKSVLGLEGIGQYEQFLFLAGSVSFFWLNGLIRGLLPLCAEKKQWEAGFFNAFLLLSLLSAITAVLVLLVAGAWGPLMAGYGVKDQLWMLALYLIFASPANLTEYYLLVRKKKKAIIASGLLSYLLLMLFVLIPVWLGFGVAGCIRGLVLWAFCRYFVLWLVVLRKLPFRFSWPYQKEHIRVSYPLVLAALVSGSAQYVDGFIIRFRYNEQVFAVFRYGARELPLVSLLANGLSNALLPVFANGSRVEVGLGQLRKKTSAMADYLFPLSAIMLISAHLLFPVLFNSRFAVSATVFNIYLLLITSRLLFSQTILVGMKETGFILWASVFELVMNVALSLIFVRYWGIAGVAWATVLAYLAEKLLLVCVVRKKLNIPLSKYQNISRHLIYSLLLLLLFYLVEFVIY